MWTLRAYLEESAILPVLGVVPAQVPGARARAGAGGQEAAHPRVPRIGRRPPVGKSRARMAHA
eukprot:2857488-Pyramimonas_sp.AAC.1